MIGSDHDFVGSSTFQEKVKKLIFKPLGFARSGFGQGNGSPQKKCKIAMPQLKYRGKAGGKSGYTKAQLIGGGKSYDDMSNDESVAFLNRFFDCFVEEADVASIRRVEQVDGGFTCGGS